MSINCFLEQNIIVWRAFYSSIPHLKIFVHWQDYFNKAASLLRYGDFLDNALNSSQQLHVGQIVLNSIFLKFFALLIDAWNSCSAYTKDEIKNVIHWFLLFRTYLRARQYYMPWKGLLQWLGINLDKEMRLFYIQATLLVDLVNCLQRLYFIVVFKDWKAPKIGRGGYLWHSIAVMGGLLALVYHYVWTDYGCNIYCLLCSLCLKD